MIPRLVVIGVLAALSSCGGVPVEGRVVNPRGEALPGVVVQAGTVGPQDLTNVRGEYRLRLEPGDRILTYSKSGYTRAERRIDAAARSGGALEDMVLWQLPLQPGVYLVDDFRYTETPRLVPQQYFLEDESVALGVEIGPAVVTSRDVPLIVCYRTPRYDARLSRLVEVQATRPFSGADSFPVWVAAGTLAVALEPVDQPDAELLRVAMDRPLEPGVYAVHWGALEGYNTLDNRIYLFEVAPPPSATVIDPLEPGDASAPEGVEGADPTDEPDATTDS